MSIQFTFNTQRTNLFKRISSYAGFVVMGVGGAVLVGWLLNIPILKSLLPGMTTMKFNTALLFVLVGAALSQLNTDTQRGRLITHGCAIVVIVLALLTLSQDIFHNNLGIDQWFVPDLGASTRPGRMSPITSISLIMLGFSLLLISLSRYYRLAHLLILLVALQALLTVIGYLYDMRSLYQILTTSSIALHTGVTLLILSIGMLLSRPEHGFLASITRDTVGGMSARGVLPAAIIIPIVLGWLNVQAQHAGWYTSGFQATIFVVLSVAIFALIIYLNALFVDYVDNQRRQAEEALRQSYHELEIRVQDRTTNLTQANEKLTESQRFIQRVLEATPDQVYMYDLTDGRVTFINHQDAHTLVHNQAQPDPTHDAYVANLVHPDDFKRLVRLSREHFGSDNPEVFENEYRMRDANGEWRWFYGREILFSVKPDGTPWQVMGTARDITERKSMEDALRRSENLYRTLVNNLPDTAVTMFDQDMRYTLAEGPFLERAGYDKDLIEGKTPRETMPPERSAVILPYFEAALKGASNSFERSRDDLTYHATFVPLRDEATNITGGMAVWQDITKRKQAEEALRESEKRFRALVTHSPVGIFQTDAKGECVFVNPRWSEMTGFSEAETLGTGWVNAIHPDDLEWILGVWSAAEMADRAFTMDYRFRRPDGEVVWVSGSMIALRNEAGTVTGFFGTVTDISERRAMAAELTEKEERFRQLAENIDNAFWMMTADSRQMIYVSPAYERIWGHTCESLYENPKSFSDAIHPDDRERVLTDRIQKIMRSEYNIEYRILRPDGSERWVWSRAFPIPDDDGEVYRIAGISEDITERKKAEKQAVELELEKEKNRLLSDFITITSHELKTPLTVINTSLYLCRKVTDPQKQIKYLDSIEVQTEQLNRLIDEIHTMFNLDLATDVETFPVDVNRVAESANMLFQKQIAEKQLRITLKLEAGLPITQANEDHLQKAVAHLLENAIIYTPENGEINILTYHEGSNITIEVADNGIGISAEETLLIFERFYKVNEARTANKSGLGLGLTMAKRIAEMHKGVIEVESAPGKGSTFRIRLPIISPTCALQTAS